MNCTSSTSQGLLKENVLRTSIGYSKQHRNHRYKEKQMAEDLWRFLPTPDTDILFTGSACLHFINYIYVAKPQLSAINHPWRLGEGRLPLRLDFLCLPVSCELLADKVLSILHCAA